LLRIILERSRLKIDSKIAEKKASFKKGRKTRELVKISRILIEIISATIIYVFCGLTKAFDQVSHDKLEGSDRGVSPYLFNIKAEMVMRETSEGLRLEEEESQTFDMLMMLQDSSERELPELVHHLDIASRK